MIAVTGGTGLLGSHLLFELTQRGFDATVLVRPNADTTRIKKVFSYYASAEERERLFSKLRFLEVDFMNPYDLEVTLPKFEQVYHCAATVSFHPKRVREMLTLNPGMTHHLINWALENGVKKFCHVSSIAALGREKNRPEVDEQAFWKSSPDNSNYAKSKYAAENEVWRGKEEGLNTVIVNPSVILGPGAWTQSSGKIFPTIANGFKFYTPGLASVVDVRDVARAMVLLMEGNHFGKRYILSAQTLPYKELTHKIADALGVEKPKKQARRWMLGALWRMEKLRSWLTGSEPLLTKETARTAFGRYRYSNQRIKNDIGFEFIPLDQTVKDIARLYRQDHPATAK